MKKYCISYLDEAKLFNTGPNNSIDHYTIVSITFDRDYYINTVEPAWNQLGLNNGIPQGQALHFTDIRNLLVPRSIEKYKPEWLSVFTKAKSPVIVDMDYQRIHSFFIDVVEFIENYNLVIQATGIRFDKQGLVRNISNRYFKNSTYQPPYHALKEHLNLMGFYLLDIPSGTFDPKRPVFLSTKLRFDGDVDLGERDDLREAFNHCISLGTRHFRPTFTKAIFDEIRFVGKDEVGRTVISHAGNEITDFITTIISRNLWNIDTQLIPVSVLGMPIIQTLPPIIAKLFNSQKIDDNLF